ncbi:unnamed protein product, partial [Discosporangium mesarthrocarpum]
DADFDVPTTIPEAVRKFLAHATPRLIIAGIAALMLVRISASPLSITDALAVPVVAVGWSFQEWAIHKYLLHGFKGWMGFEVHRQHHDLPFYHISLDPPDLVIAWTAVAGAVFVTLLPEPLSLTVLCSYMVMGLVYEWIHYIVHTR